MNVAVSVYGRFHAFDLASELGRAGVLTRLITSYPSRFVEPFGVSPALVKSFISAEIARRSLGLVPATMRHRSEPAVQFMLAEYFDRRVAATLPPCEILVGFSSFALHSFRAARERGAITVLERGSAHIEFQQALLRDEYDRFGIRYRTLAHPKAIAKELREYDEADFISTPSTFAKSTFVDRGVPERKLFCIPYGVDVDQFRPRGRQDGVFRVIHCGGLSITKGVHYLLQAFAELKLPGAELWLIGSVTEEIRPFLDRYRSPNIILKGTFPQRELPEHYSQGSVFCLNSIQDGFGMVVLQAMACGLPVICTPHSAGHDVVRDGVDGFVIPIRDVEALKDRLRYCHDHRGDTAEMGRAALARARQAFTWEHYGLRMLEAYRTALAPRGTA